MTVISVEKDPVALTLTITARFDAPVERVWQVWNDPRQLERWWGPPSHPATFVDFDLTPGGRATYCMTGPEGDRYHGWWRIVSVEPPHRLELEDGFADDDGRPNDELPTITMVVRLIDSVPDMTTMIMVSTFASLEAMDRVLAMGAEEGMAQALGQIDALVAIARRN